jgi:hypothetical protein
MLFARRLRRGVREGTITQSVRIWMQPHVKVGSKYKMDEGFIEVDAIDAIEASDVTPELARACGFNDVIDMLGIAQHGRGRNFYLTRFHYLGPGAAPAPTTSEDASERPARGPASRRSGRLAPTRAEPRRRGS